MRPNPQRPLFNLTELQAGIDKGSFDFQISYPRIRALAELGIMGESDIRTLVQVLGKRLTLGNFAKVWEFDNKGYADVYGVAAGCLMLPDELDIAWYLKIGWSPPRREGDKIVLSCHPTRQIQTRSGLISTTRPISERCFCHD